MKEKLTLRHRFLLSLAIYTTIILSLWFGYHIVTHNSVSRSERENTILAADALTVQMSAQFKQMNTVASVIAGSHYVWDFLREQNVIPYYEKATAVSEIVRKTAFPITSADSVITINEEGRFFRFSGGLSNDSLEILFETFKDASTVYTIIELEDILFFCHVVPVIDYSGQLPTPLGKVIMLTGLDRTRRMLGSGEGVDRWVIQDGIIMLSNNTELEGLGVAETEPNYGVVSTVQIEGTSLFVAAAIPDDALFPERALFYTIAFISLCLFLSMIIVLYHYLSSHIIRPMANIIAGVRDIGYGKDGCLPGSGRLPKTGRKDFDALVSDINQMLDRTEECHTELTNERQKLFDIELLRKDMRMSLLASQMDAHFVVNTLKNVKRLSDMGETDKTGRMTEGLAAILQHRHAGDALVNIFDDFQILEKYIDIMNIKFGEKYSVEYEIEDSLEALLMPGMVLQPIVENALTHGLQSKACDAKLTIKGFTRGNDVFFEVSDNGAGIPPNRLKVIQENLAQATIAELSDFPEPGLRGVALQNIQRRVRTRFGDGYGVTIDSDFGGGTTVTLSMPVISNFNN